MAPSSRGSSVVPGPAVANQAKLVEVQALGCSEGGSTMTLKQERRAVIRATSWIRRNAERPAVVNMSLAFSRNARVDRAVRRLVGSGIPVIAAAGNQGADACTKSPAHLASVITVGASTQNDRPWSGSNRVGAWTCGHRAKGISSVLADGGVTRYRQVGATSWATRSSPARSRCTCRITHGRDLRSAALAEADRDCWCPRRRTRRRTEPLALCRSSVITVRTCIGYSPPASPRSIPTT